MSLEGLPHSNDHVLAPDQLFVKLGKHSPSLPLLSQLPALVNHGKESHNTRAIIIHTQQVSTLTRITVRVLAWPFDTLAISRLRTLAHGTE